MGGYAGLKGNGAGWGGPAKGYSSGRAIPAKKGERRAALSSDDDKKLRMTRREFRKQRSEKLEDMFFDLAETAPEPMVKIHAASKLHAIYNGQPMATNLNVNLDDLGDRDAATNAAEIERLDRAASDLEARIEAGPIPSQPSGVRH